MAEDPLALLGYRPTPALPALRARPPALGYLGGDSVTAESNWLNYATKPLPVQQPAPGLTSAGLPDIETVQRNMQAGYTEALKAKRAQEGAILGVVNKLGTLNPRSPDYLTQRNQLLQAAPWALQSKDVENILGTQEEAHREHLGEIKGLGEFSQHYNDKLNTLLKEGKNPAEANDLAMASAMTAKARIDFMEQGAPREVVDRVFKKDGTFDREALAEWKGEQKRAEFDKKMATEKGGFIPISQDESEEIVGAVEATLTEPSIKERIDAYNSKHATKYEIDEKSGTPKGDFPSEVYKEGWNLVKQQRESALRKIVNKLALSGKKIPKALERFVDSEVATDDLNKVLEAKLSGAEKPAGASATPAAKNETETSAQRRLREAREAAAK